MEEPLANARGSVSATKSTRLIRAATVRERFPEFFSSLPKKTKLPRGGGLGYASCFVREVSFLGRGTDSFLS
ncbi:MAG: hypothetical protein A3J28_04120 [Acidobacteria bacterium RIFCSPLOWO2_12_FULL_60_22]|nr:MAG: hypothetical protein A3J28_04120 [Acidobacteria bacterium RIFCSPLOWO2_12_FULL_60_22]